MYIMIFETICMIVWSLLFLGIIFSRIHLEVNGHSS